jgi:hypothetical protein
LAEGVSEEKITMWKWSFKTGELLKEVQIMWNFLWQDMKKVTI